MPRMTYIKSIFGETISVQEGTIRTRAAFEQWWGWTGKGHRHRPGLKDQYCRGIQDLEWIIDYIGHMIDAGFTHTFFDGTTEKVIDDYNEESFYEDLENLRDSLNGTLNEAAKRRPLKRRIELLQQVIDLNSTPEDRANAQGRIDRAEATTR